VILMTRSLIRIVAVTSIVVSVAVAVPQIVARTSEGPYTMIVLSLNALGGIVYVAVGWLITERRPGNRIGPILLAIGAIVAWAGPADMYLSLPQVDRFEGLLSRLQDPDGYAATHAIASVAGLYLAIVGLPITILGTLALILFPDGRLPSGRWRWVIPTAVFSLTLGIVAVLLSDRPILLAWPTYRSPLAIAGFPGETLSLIADRLVLVLALAAAVALLGRWRRDDPVERAQIKWVVAAVLIWLGTETVERIFDTGRYEWQTAILGVVVSMAFVLVAVAIGVAILRYHLYDIDRVISRTVGWTVVTGALVTIFVLAVISMQSLSAVVGLHGAVAGVAQGETLAVAASTLLAFALFQPLRQRVQRTVDRRFDRARYDADRTAVAFSERLRHETDMETVTQDLVRTTDLALAPTTRSIWLRGGPS
jgi:hypothetical protein